MVLVPVLVQDSDGRPVKGLAKENFTIEENGLQRTVSSFEEIESSAEPLPSQASPASGEFTNTHAARTPRRLVVIAIDTINTRVFDQNYARQQLTRFLSDSVTPDALIALVSIHMTGIRVVHDFTDDPKVLIEALAKLRSNPAYSQSRREDMPDKSGATEAQLQEFLQFEVAAAARTNAAEQHSAIERTLETMQQIGRAYAGVPGRKALVWVSAGFPFSSGDTTKMAIYERTWKVLNDANFAIYSVDARGLVAPEFYRSVANTSWKMRDIRQRWLKEDQEMEDSLATLRDFATATGGKAFLNTNDLTSSFRTAANDGSHYYMLGYYLKENDAKPGWHKLKVRVQRSGGVHVRARTGFFVLGATQSTKRQDGKREIAMALTSPLELTEMPISVRWTERQPSEDTKRVKVGFTLSLRPEGVGIDEADGNRMGFEAEAVAVTATGAPAANVGHSVDVRLTSAQVQSIRSTGATYNDFFLLPPGRYKATFAVRDLVTGRIGSVVVPLEIESPSTNTANNKGR